MTTDYKVTELFCIIDEFCKHFDAENAGNLFEDVSNFIMNLISALGAYCFFDNKPKALQGYCIEDTKQLSLF